jgi:hypothetical protein
MDQLSQLPPAEAGSFLGSKIMKHYTEVSSQNQ